MKLRIREKPKYVRLLKGRGLFHEPSATKVPELATGKRMVPSTGGLRMPYAPRVRDTETIDAELIYRVPGNLIGSG